MEGAPDPSVGHDGSAGDAGVYWTTSQTLATTWTRRESSVRSMDPLTQTMFS